MKKVMMLTTTAYMSERFNRNNILILEKMGYEVHVAANFARGNPTTPEVLENFKVWIEAHHGKWFDIAVTKNPTDVLNNYKAYRRILHLIEKYRYEFIHCHTPVGGVLGRFAAHRMHTRVIYTAHGFHFFKGAPVKNWLLYYPVERFLSRFTDILITINREDYNRAKKSFHAGKIEYVPGVGIDLKKFCPDAKSREAKREELGLGQEDIMLLSVGELSKTKNHKVILSALKRMKNPRLKYFICGEGKLEEKYRRLIGKLQMEQQVFLLKYREDISELCRAADLYVFPSLREGLPVALMEAIATKTPVVCARVRGNTDLVEDENCLFHPKSWKNAAECMLYALENDMQRAVEENYERLGSYELDRVSDKIAAIYERD